MDILLDLPRLIYIGFSVYALFLVLFRWQTTRVMTMDRRFLLLFFVMELVVTTLSGVLKSLAGVTPDASTWLTVLTQSFLTAYLHYSIPPAFRRFHYRFTRRPR